LSEERHAEVTGGNSTTCVGSLKNPYVLVANAKAASDGVKGLTIVELNVPHPATIEVAGVVATKPETMWVLTRRSWLMRSITAVDSSLRVNESYDMETTFDYTKRVVGKTVLKQGDRKLLDCPLRSLARET
jgi:hypothetical protein